MGSPLETSSEEIKNPENNNDIIQFLILKELDALKTKIDNSKNPNVEKLKNDLKKIHENLKLLKEELGEIYPKIEETIKELGKDLELENSDNKFDLKKFEKKLKKLETGIKESFETMKTSANSIVEKTLQDIENIKYAELNEKQKKSIKSAANIIIIIKRDKPISFTKKSISDIAKGYGKNEKIIQFFLQLKLEEKAEDKKTQTNEDEEFFLVHQAGKFEILTKEEYKKFTNILKEKEKYKKESEIDEENGNAPKWLKGPENENLRKKLKASSDNQENYDLIVKEKISKSPLFKILDFFLGGILTSLAQGNSVMGRFLRSFTGIPEPEKIQSPIAMNQGGESLKQKYLGKGDENNRNNKQEINEIVERISKLPTSSERPDSKSESIMLTLEKGFDLPPNVMTHSFDELEKSTNHSIIIKPKTEKEFTRIYAFLQSPVKGGLGILQDVVKDNAGTLPVGVGGVIESGMEKLSTISETNDFGIEGGGNTLLDFMAPKSGKIESGIPQFSKIKSEIRFPANLDIKTRPNGDIVINWNEKNKKNSEQSQSAQSEQSEQSEQSQQQSEQPAQQSAQSEQPAQQSAQSEQPAQPQQQSAQQLAQQQSKLSKVS